MCYRYRRLGPPNDYRKQHAICTALPQTNAEPYTFALMTNNDLVAITSEAIKVKTATLPIDILTSSNYGNQCIQILVCQPRRPECGREQCMATAHIERQRVHFIRFWPTAHCAADARRPGSRASRHLIMTLRCSLVIGRQRVATICAT
jgi:hypothetical protein